MARLLIHVCGLDLGLVVRVQVGAGTPRHLAAGAVGTLLALLAETTMLAKALWRHWSSPKRIRVAPAVISTRRCPARLWWAQ